MTERKLAVISDFHLDANQFTTADYDVFEHVLQEEKITDLHFAGDMSNDFHGLTLPFFERLTGKYDVSYNLGNHDMLSLSEDEIDRTDFTVKPLGSKTLLAFHGWYDYSFYDGDKAKIQHFKNNFYFDRKIVRQLDDLATTEKILAQLELILPELNSEVIIAMHFVPERHFIFPPYFEKFARFNAFLGSEKFHEIFRKFPNVTDVVFGHVHHRFPSRKIDGITYHARPLGYTYDWEMIDRFMKEHPKTQVPNAYQLKKRYLTIKKLPEWADFRASHLSEEFRSVMTIFKL